MSKNIQKYDVIIIGAGPAGLAAAIYTSRAVFSTLVIDESSAGGQVKTTHQVANYPGFVEPIAGHELAGNMRKQAEKYGTKFKLAADITNLHLSDQEKWLEFDDEENVKCYQEKPKEGALTAALESLDEEEDVGDVKGAEDEEVLDENDGEEVLDDDLGVTNER